MIWKLWKTSIFYYKTINTACNLFKFTLCPTVRWNNSVSAGITLCPLLQCYSHMNSYAPYCSAKPPEKELFPYCSIILAHTYINIELLALGSKIDISKPIYRYLLAFRR
jgi:hypothetical protein